MGWPAFPGEELIVCEDGPLRFCELRGEMVRFTEFRGGPTRREFRLLFKFMALLELLLLLLLLLLSLLSSMEVRWIAALLSKTSNVTAFKSAEE
jgi:hypothetical protein